MGRNERIEIIKKIEALRPGRTLLCLFNFDRLSAPTLPGLLTNFDADAKEAIFRVLRDADAKKVDVCLYTRGGDTNSVWPIVSIIREFDPDFEVLVPFRCHSSGTLLALGAKQIHLAPLAELSPIDPSTGNQFNPFDPTNKQMRLAISVEDVIAYRSFIVHTLTDDDEEDDEQRVVHNHLPLFLEKLADKVHPLALGNVERVLQQIRYLAESLLKLHPIDNEPVDDTIDALTTAFWSHVHMINRHEAKRILGDRVTHAEAGLAIELDNLLRAYEDAFELRTPLFLAAHMRDEPMKEASFVGGILEAAVRSYVYETRLTIRQHSSLPENVQVQLPPGQPMPLVSGLPREYQVEVTAQGWVSNKEAR